MNLPKLILLIAVCHLPALLQAQETPQNILLQPQASQYFLGSQDEVLIKVDILGYVQKPGRYLIPLNTDLLSLLSFAGGKADGANLRKVYILRKRSSFNSNNGEPGKTEVDTIITVNLERYFKTGQMKYRPVLQAGDSVLVPQSAGSKFRNLVGFNSIISLALATTTILYAIDRLK